jgi:hypothetical protein
LNKNPKQRLGAQSDVEEILSHPWFKDINKEKMLKKEVKMCIFRSQHLSNPKSKETSGFRALIKSLLLKLQPTTKGKAIRNHNSTRTSSRISENNDYPSQTKTDPFTYYLSII